MKNYFSGGFRLGILGGGQLGRMLIQDCIDLNITADVLDPAANAPCSRICSRFTKGSFQDFDTVYQFGKSVDMITIEIENVNVEALEKLEKEGTPVYPQPSVIRIIQDKGEQKQFYQKHKIPTAPFVLIKGKPSVKEFGEKMPYVQKLRREGYDGRGIFKIYEEGHFEDTFEEPSVMEAMLDIEKEISVIVARDIEGHMQAFDPVEMEFHPAYNLVEYLVAPAHITKKQQEEAVTLAKDVADKLGIVGILAVEMFIDKNGELLVNECAPRPHNSGHHTIEACHTSQYQQLLRAILGLPLGNPSLMMPAVMINLLGEPEVSGVASYHGIKEALEMDGVKLHLYGKNETRPGRKMGHVTVVDLSVKEAHEKAQQIKKILKVLV
ncbi:MAG: 5-(carboxyamino)imidazole ribonucleotide synthase [Bacteroidia bacterium]